MSVAVLMRWWSISSTMSPRCRPAASAGLPATTWATCSPRIAPARAATSGASRTWLLAIPSQARRTRPDRDRVSMIPRVVALIGTASPRPTPATAVLTPTIRPALSASTPPELPGLRAASVWITSSMTRPDAVGSDRPSADTIPAVTLPASPSGLPIASHELADLQTRSVAPRDARGTASELLSTARSDSTSRPTTSAVTSVPSPKAAVTVCAPSTT